MDMRLEDGSICLRPFEESDADRLFEAVIESKHSLSPYLFWCHEHYSRDDSTAWISEQTKQSSKPAEEYNFAVVDSATGAFIGGAGVSHISYINRTGDVGYWVRSSLQGQGIAVRAALLTVRFCFERLGLLRVEIVVQTDNPKSVRVAEKLGALREGVLRNKIFVNGRSRDAFCYSLIPGECRETKE